MASARKIECLNEACDVRFVPKAADQYFCTDRCRFEAGGRAAVERSKFAKPKRALVPEHPERPQVRPASELPSRDLRPSAVYEPEPPAPDTLTYRLLNMGPRSRVGDMKETMTMQEFLDMLGRIPPAVLTDYIAARETEERARQEFAAAEKMYREARERGEAARTAREELERRIREFGKVPQA